MSGKFAIGNLDRLAYARGFTLWIYRAGTTSLRDCAQPDFFLEAEGVLQPSDMIIVATHGGAGVLVVRRVEPGRVETAGLLS